MIRSKNPNKSVRYTAASLAFVAGGLSVAGCGSPSSFEDEGTRTKIVHAELVPGANIRTSPHVPNGKDSNLENVCAQLDEKNAILNADALEISKNSAAEIGDANGPWYRISTASITGEGAESIRNECPNPVYISIRSLVDEPAPKIVDLPQLPTLQN